MQTTLFVLAHNDDEFFCSALLEDELSSGNDVRVVYTTHGSLHGADSDRRMAESEHALRDIGVPRENVYFLGRENNVFDGTLDAHLSRSFESLMALASNWNVTKLVTMSWEGGHTDHDATHLAVAAFARAKGIEEEVFEFPAYNGFQIRPPFFRTGQLMNGRRENTSKLSLRRAVRLLRVARHYRSQWKSFMGLMPGIVLQLILKRRQEYRLVPAFDYLARPHSGPLFYETRFKRSFSEFSENAKEFILTKVLDRAGEHDE